MNMNSDDHYIQFQSVLPVARSVSHALSHRRNVTVFPKSGSQLFTVCVRSEDYSPLSTARHSG